MEINSIFLSDIEEDYINLLYIKLITLPSNQLVIVWKNKQVSQSVSQKASTKKYFIILYCLSFEKHGVSWDKS